MEVTEFIKEKNKIIYDLTGITLVPEGQIQKVPKQKLHFKNDATACPYCHEYYFRQEGDCGRCPIYEARNGCNEEAIIGTYDLLQNWVSSYTNFNDISDWYQSIPELVALYEKYNKQFKDLTIQPKELKKYDLVMCSYKNSNPVLARFIRLEDEEYVIEELTQSVNNSVCVREVNYPYCEPFIGTPPEAFLKLIEGIGETKGIINV